MAVTYNRTNWQNRVVQRPRTYVETVNSDESVTHAPAPGEVVQAGTPLNEENLNNIENGIVDLVAGLNEALETIQSILNTLAAYNTRIGNNERSITDIQQVDETQSGHIADLTRAHNALEADEGALKDRADAHIANRSNPHQVGKAQVGLGNVPNVTTNDQTPTFTEASSDQMMVSGEKLGLMLGKLQRGLRRLWAHISNTANPHQTDKAQVGLGNVPNVTTNNQTPTISETSDWETIPTGTGTNLTTILSKLRAGLMTFRAHLVDTDNPHNTGVFDAGGVSIPMTVGEPDAAGTYNGNGSDAGTIIVNGKERRGQMIDVGFPPSRVVILILSTGDRYGKNEEQVIRTDGSHMFDLTEILLGGKWVIGTVFIAPLKNYYHADCGIEMATAAPQTVLDRNHGCAVVYGNGFIVQSYLHRNSDSTMYINDKGRNYIWLAWR